MKRTLIISVLFLCLFILTLSSCSVVQRITATKTPTLTATPEATETPLPTLTPTPPPSIGRVEDVYIWDEDFNGKREQIRDAYQQAGEEIPNDEALNQLAWDRLLEESIFLATANRSGLTPSADEAESRLRSLAEKMGGEDALRDWQNQNHYSDDGLRRAMQRELAVARVREQVLAERLPGLEQVHAYRISTDSQGELQQAQEQLNMGVSFISVAANYNDLTGGDMDWFPRGVLFDKELEEKIFALQPGSWTDVIQRDGKYELYFVAERQSGRELSSQTRPAAEHLVLSQWLEEQKNSLQIEKFH